MSYGTLVPYAYLINLESHDIYLIDYILYIPRYLLLYQ